MGTVEYDGTHLKAGEAMLLIEKAIWPGAQRGWTGEEYDRLTQAGFLGAEERLELIEGAIVPKMSQNPPHSTLLYLATLLLQRIFGEGFLVRAQMPLQLGDSSRPEPDIAVVVGAPRDYLAAHPDTAVLVVEISDSTLAADREVKAGLYARAGIAEYWIVNVVSQVLEVRRAPVADAAEPLGWTYGETRRLTPGQSIAPLAAPNDEVQVSDLLP